MEKNGYLKENNWNFWRNDDFSLQFSVFREGEKIENKIKKMKWRRGKKFLFFADEVVGNERDVKVGVLQLN